MNHKQWLKMNDVEIIKHQPHCLRHDIKEPGIHTLEYDSYYCSKCNRWLEPHCYCGGDDCAEFPNRPDKPFPRIENFDPNKSYYLTPDGWKETDKIKNHYEKSISP